MSAGQWLAIACFVAVLAIVAVGVTLFRDSDDAAD